jgi:hypothetical protein
LSGKTCQPYTRESQLIKETCQAKLAHLHRALVSQQANQHGRLPQGSNFIAAIAVEREQNAVYHCGNDGNFLPYSAIFILFTVHYYFDT